MKTLNGAPVTATVAATFFQGLLVTDVIKTEPDYLVFMDVTKLKLEENNPDAFGNELAWILENIPGHAEKTGWSIGLEELGTATGRLDALTVGQWNDTPRFYWDGTEMHTA
jgi:hypothetical protein